MKPATTKKSTSAHVLQPKNVSSETTISKVKASNDEGKTVVHANPEKKPSKTLEEKGKDAFVKSVDKVKKEHDKKQRKMRATTVNGHEVYRELEHDFWDNQTPKAKTNSTATHTTAAQTGKVDNVKEGEKKVLEDRTHIKEE